MIASQSPKRFFREEALPNLEQRAMNDDHKKTYAFPTTRWSVVDQTLDPDPGTRDLALNTICEIYRGPIYCFIRLDKTMQGVTRAHAISDAEDLTHDFLVHLKTKKVIQKADRSKGQLRSFLLGCVKNFLLDSRRRLEAEKRGGQMEKIDTEHLDALYQEVCSWTRKPEDPSEAFNVRFALDRVGEAFSEIEEQYERKGRAHFYEAIEDVLIKGTSVTEAAERLELRESSVRVILKRFRDKLKDIIARDLFDANEEAVIKESKDLLSLLVT